MRIRTLVLLSAVVAAVIVAVTGCSAAQSPSDPSPRDTESTFNQADVAFTMMMMPHHEQAIDMADILLAKDGIDQRVVELATAIKEAQGPEIETMEGWLAAWGASRDHGMDHGGMMSDDDMAALDASEGSEASRLFLEQMTVHHQGAIDAAEQEVDNGENPDAVALAGKIVLDQTAEIPVMQQLLDTL